MNPDIMGKDCVLRVYDFSPSFTQDDLIIAVKDLENHQVMFRWNNDTETLLIFNTPTDARKIYLANLGSLEFKIDVYNVENNTDARPVKTDVVVRRMVAGALGIKYKDKDCPKLEKALNDKRSLEYLEKKKLEDLDQAWDE